jgi:GT2 family glycosyltransferase
VKQIAILINSFNRLELLQSSLSALEAWISKNPDDFGCRIYVFDAGSTDGSLDFLRERTTPKFHLLTPAPGQDSSIAGGFNAAAAAALSNPVGTTHLLLYETDNAIHSADAVKSALAELDARSELAACGFTVRRHDGRPAGVGMQFPRLRSFLLGQRLSQFFHMDRVPYRWEASGKGKFSCVDVVFTSPLLVKAGAWKDTEGMDSEAFPFSDCDVDWARRLALNGWKMGVVETPDVIHDNQKALSEWSKNRAIDFHRARLRYFRRYRPAGIFLIWPWLLMLRHALELLAAGLFIRDAQRRDRLIRQFSRLICTCTSGYS